MGSSEKEGIKRNSNTFNSALLPKTLRVGYLNVGVDLYIPNALQCFTCFKYGHHDCRCKKSRVDRKRRFQDSPVFMRPRNCASPDFPIPRFLRASRFSE